MGQSARREWFGEPAEIGPLMGLLTADPNVIFPPMRSGVPYFVGPVSSSILNTRSNSWGSVSGGATHYTLTWDHFVAPYW